MEAQNPPPPQLEMTLVQYEQLPVPPELNQSLLGQLDTHLKGHWTASFQCVTMLRSICKAYPQFTPDIFTKYGPTILDLFGHATTLLIKNILKLLYEIFSLGIEVNLEGCVNAFLPILFKKAANESVIHIRQACQVILTVIATKCCYCNTIEITTQTSCDKNLQISQLAVKMLASIVINIGKNLTQINPNTLQIIMRGMSYHINGKRNNLRTSALDICLAIFGQIGSENYLQLMNYSLSEQQVQMMGEAMQTHRTQKNKAPHFSQVLKQQKMQMGGIRQSGAFGQNLRM